MADKHVIEVTLEANTKKFKDALKQTLNFAKQSEKSAGGGQAAQKNKERKQTTARKDTTKHYQQILKHEKALEKQMQKNLQMLEKVNKAHAKQVALLKTSSKASRGAGRGRGGTTTLFSGPGSFGGGGGPGGGMTAGGAMGKIGQLAAKAVLAGASRLWGAMRSTAAESYGSTVSYRKAQAGLIGTGANLGDLRASRAGGEGLGYGPQESLSHAREAAVATGSLKAATTAQSLARITTLDPSSATGFMGAMTRAGQGFGGAAGQGGQRVLQRIMTAATAKGFDKARIPEVFKSVQNLVDVQGRAIAGDVGTGNILKLVSAMQKSGQSGLQGARGGGVLQQLDNAIRNPGGGAQGQAFMLRAAGHGTPQGGTSYYDALKKLEQGAFGDADMVTGMFKQAEAEFGGGEATNLALKEVTGLSLSNLEAMREIVESGATSAEKEERLNKIAESSKSIEEQALEAMKSEFGKESVRAAGLENRLVELGNKLVKPLQKMQDVLIRLIDEYFPLMVTLLETLAQVAEDVAAWIGKKDPLEKGEYKKTLEQSRNEQEELKKQRMAGLISEDQYTLSMAKQQAIIRHTNKLMGEKMGSSSQATGGVWDLLTGGKIEDTDLMKRTKALIEGVVSEQAASSTASSDPFAATKRAAQGYLRGDVNEEKRKAYDQASSREQEKMFMPGGAFFTEYMKFLEANNSQYKQALEVAKEAARAAADVARESAADGSAARKRPIGNAEVVTGDGSN